MVWKGAGDIAPALTRFRWRFGRLACDSYDDSTNSPTNEGQALCLVPLGKAASSNSQSNVDFPLSHLPISAQRLVLGATFLNAVPLGSTNASVSFI